MASSKDTFEGHTWRANSFAAGMFRGVGTATATLVGKWYGVIIANSDNQRIEANAMQPRIEAAAITRVTL
jgi:hypothetical protein